jgi:hypothetical protein
VLLTNSLTLINGSQVLNLWELLANFLRYPAAALNVAMPSSESFTPPPPAPFTLVHHNNDIIWSQVVCRSALRLIPLCNMLTPRKRQRVTRACDLCKRKKKQCSGTQPCATCHSKSASCTFSVQDQHHQQHQQHLNQHQHSHSRASFRSHEHSDNDASDSLDSPLHHKAPSNNRRTSGGLHNARRQAPPPPKESAREDATPIQNHGRLLQDGEGRLGEQYHGYRQCAVVLRV